MDFGKKKPVSANSSSSSANSSSADSSSSSQTATPEEVRKRFLAEQVELHNKSGSGVKVEHGASNSTIMRNNVYRSGGMLGAQPKRPTVKPRGILRDPTKADKMVLNLLELSKEGKALRDAQSAADDPHRSAFDPATTEHSNAVKKFNKPTDGVSRVLPGMKFQPLNPLLEDRHESIMARRPPGKDPNAIFNPSSRRKLSKMRFTEAQTDAIVDAWAAKQGGLWGTCWKYGTKIIDPRYIKRYKRIGNFGVFICMFVVVGIIYWHYRTEMDLFMLLDGPDQEAYKAVMLNGRVCEWRHIAEEALDRSDPLRIGSDKDKMKTIIQAWRDEGLVDRDWEVWARNNRKSLFKEKPFDIFAEFFWLTIMYSGRYLIGGGYVWMDTASKLDQDWAAADQEKRQRSKKQKEKEMQQLEEEYVKGGSTT